MFEFPPARTEPKTTTNSPAGFSLAGVIFISGHGVSTILGYRVKSKWARGSRERGFSNFYSYYPQTTVNDYKVALDVTDQRKQEAIDFMYAKTEGCNKATPQVFLKFYHKLSNLVLEVQPGNGLTQEDLKKMTVTVKGQNTKATFNLADGTISGEENPADITMKTTEAGKLYEAILLPTEEASRVIEFELNNGYDAPFVWTMPAKLEGGKRYHYTVVKLSRSAVDISGTIKPWTEAGDNNEHIAQ